MTWLDSPEVHVSESTTLRCESSAEKTSNLMLRVWMDFGKRCAETFQIHVEGRITKRITTNDACVSNLRHSTQSPLSNRKKKRLEEIHCFTPKKKKLRELGKPCPIKWSLREIASLWNRHVSEHSFPVYSSSIRFDSIPRNDLELKCWLLTEQSSREDKPGIENELDKWNIMPFRAPDEFDGSCY